MARTNTHELDARINFLIYGTVKEEGPWTEATCVVKLRGANTRIYCNFACSIFSVEKQEAETCYCVSTH